ncbi:MAG: 30S ribosomal protein S1 [Desulfobacteraceae bacterium]|jgi:small subunit ribosomal protein S1
MDEDHPNNPDDPSGEEPEESFAELFESYSSGMNEDIRVGDKIQGKIIAISDNAVFVDTGTKADGIVELEELKDEDGNLPYSAGDTLELFVVAANESEIRLSKAIAGIGGLTMLRDAYANAIPVEGKVVQTIKGGFQVEVLKRRAFCPISQIDTLFVEDAEVYVGQVFQFRITKLAEGGRNIVLSRRDLLEAELQKQRKAFMQDLSVDQLYTGRVTRLMPYGAFVELTPGVEGMVHISELSWSRVEKPEDVVNPGDKIDVKVLRIEPGDKQMKIALSAKQVTGNPWDRVDEEVVAGEKMTGTVTRCAPFGAFVELKPGIEGLVHISEMSYTRRVVQPEDIVTPGQSVSVLVKEVDPVKRRIGLSIRDAEGDPWLDVGEKFTVGQRIKGKVEKREKFGIFIALAPGIVGLLPRSVIQDSPAASQMESLKPGDGVKVVISGIQAAERRISLGLGEGDDQIDWRQFSQNTRDSGQSGLGSLGDKLAEALKKKQ